MTTAPHPLLLRRLAEAALRWPDRPAVSAGPRTATFREFSAIVVDTAQALRASGVQPGDHIGMCMARGIEQVSMIFAAWACGGAYVALDPKLPPARLLSMAEQARLKLVVTDASAPTIAWPDTLPLTSIPASDDGARTNGPQTLLALADQLDRELGPRSDDLLAYVIFTSGSTGQPKGVAVEHRTLRYFTDAFDAVLGSPGPDAVWISGAALSFDMSVPEVIGALTTGSHVVIRNRLEPIAPIVTRHGGSHLQCTPSQLALFASEASERAALAQLRHLIVAGEALPVPLAQDVRRLMRADARFTNAYGPTEITVYAFSHDIVEPPTAAVPIGTAFEGTTWAVVDAQREQMPAGSMGELVISGAGVTRGYIGRPDITAAAFVDLVWEAGGPFRRCYLTGDLVTAREDGSLDFHGRRDHQVKVRGHRIELGEIEAVLAADPGVLLAVARAVDNGEGDVRLLVDVCAREGHSLDAAALRAACARMLPVYMVPAAIVIHADLPRTSTGKVDRTALAALPPPWADRTDRTEDGSDAVDADAMAALATSDRLAVMQQLWSKRLGVAVGADDDFFDLGGHSLLGVEVLVAVEGTFGRRLPLGTLIEATTPRSLLAAVDAEDEPSRSVVTMRDGATPSIVFIHGAGGYLLKLAGLAQRLDGARHVVGIAAHGLDGKHDPDADVDTMIRRYVADLAIDGVTADVLIGYSGGGLVAAGMAAELVKRGAPAPLIILLDTDLPCGGVPTRVDHWRNLAFNVVRGGRDTMKAWSAARRSRGNEAERRRLVRAEAAGHGFVDIQDHLEAILAAYQPPQIASPIVLVRAAETNPSERPNFAWETRTTGDVRVLTCPGDHFSMLEPPNVDALANMLNAALAARLATPTP